MSKGKHRKQRQFIYPPTNAQLQTHLLAIMDLVAQQAEDEGLWFKAETAPEAYLQQELRKLHALIEGDEHITKAARAQGRVNTARRAA